VNSEFIKRHQQRQYNTSLDSDFLREYQDPAERSRVAAMVVDPLMSIAEVTKTLHPLGLAGKVYRGAETIYNLYDGYRNEDISSAIKFGVGRKTQSLIKFGGGGHISQQIGDRVTRSVVDSIELDFSVK
jgi:hypothetical protein